MDNSIIEKFEVSKEDLKLINSLTKRNLKADEVYTFSVVLCDNDIDRDFDRFTPEALEKLATLFVGKTGIFDHSGKGRDQIARIYECHTEKTGELLPDGESYVCLKAKAYLPRTEKTKDFILNLDAGIFKEVSVGCSVLSEVCSICGRDARKEVCEHIKGRSYTIGKQQKQCFYWLDKPTDAYEWSFVAVPAQRRAGVVKSFKTTKGETNMDILELVKGFKDEDTALTGAQVKKLKGEIGRLSLIADSYIKQLKGEAIKKAATAFPNMDTEVLDGILEKLEPEEIKALTKAFDEARLEATQLSVLEPGVSVGDNGSFMI